jgi:deoxyhypusine synthase
VRIYDIFFDYSVLLDTDAFFRQIIRGDEFQRTMSTAEFHWLCGKYIAERQKALGQKGARCWRPATSTTCPSTRRRPATRPSA